MVHPLVIIKKYPMEKQTSKFPEVGWMKERFQILQLNEQICEFDWTIQPGGSVPEHYHKESEEYFKVLEGEVSFMINGELIIGKPNFELTIPKLIYHSVSNKSSQVAKCRVSYQPVADQGKFFEILFFLFRKNPDDKNALFKAMYISKQMGYREFSSLKGGMKILMGIMMSFIKLFAPITGWNKLLNDYRLKPNP